MLDNYSRIIKYSSTPRTDSREIIISKNSINNTNKKKKNILKIIITGIIVLLIIIIAIFITILVNTKNLDFFNLSSDSEDKPQKLSIEDMQLLGSEFIFNTKKGDLKRIQVNQKYTENISIDGERITTFLARKTNYDIYIIDEQNSDEENKYYYKKLYTCAISIQSECLSSKDDNCEPKKMIDFTNSDKEETKRNLEGRNNNIDLKDIPLPICLFNLTDNDVITSIICPESLPETKKKIIILDLYFFRPPGLKRLNKEDINSTIIRVTEGNRKYIRETNGGICDIENGQFSFCTTDMNTTTDLENNILTYDEEAIMNITLDDNNTYNKNKITKLIDESNKTENLNPEIYEEKLNITIQKLNPYLKYEELFSKDDFYEYYVNYMLSKNGSAPLNERQIRILDNTNDKMIEKENNLFHLFSHESGITVDLNLFNNLGINSEFMSASNNLYIENNKAEDISSSNESSISFNKIIKELYILSKSGNHLANDLYQKINTNLEDLTEKMNKEMSGLKNLII